MIESGKMDKTLDVTTHIVELLHHVRNDWTAWLGVSFALAYILFQVRQNILYRQTLSHG